LKKLIGTGTGLSAVAIATVVLTAGIAFAAISYSLFGGATIVPGGSPGNAAQITTSGTQAFGGVNLNSDSVTTLADLTNLTTDYEFTEGSCASGSPRFGATLTNGTTTGTVFFYLGTAPNYTDCPPNVWTNTGNLAAATNLVDTSQLPGGTFYDVYGDAQLRYGDYTVSDLFIVADQPGQTLLVDNINVNSDVVTFDEAAPPPATKDDCKQGGYANFTGEGGPGPFANQGQCVSYFATGGSHTGD
jgi:hypothetical protein